MNSLKKIAFISVLAFIAFAFTTKKTHTTAPFATYPKTNSKMDEFISKLMQKMTIDEKIGQLNLLTGGDAVTGDKVNTNIENKIKNGQVGGFLNLTTPQKIRKAQELAINHTRLKIPLIFGLDVIHGYKTIFPIPLALSSTWDMSLIEKTAKIAAQEATADGLNWTFSPMVDISRDPRWGRVSEGGGEDPFLGAEIAKAMVKGYQGNDLAAKNTMMACIKHFALYGGTEAGLEYNTVDMSPVRMYNEYFLPYKAGIDAGAGSIMTSFNEINGIPATANKWLFTDILRNQWKFNGLVVTDYTSIKEMVDHGYGDLKDVTEKALKAGIDMDMVAEAFLLNLKQSYNEGKVTMLEIDRACRLILEAKYKLGLFEDPFKYCDEKRAATEFYAPENLKFTREVATKSFVLLKNNNVLPLKKQGTIALIGPLANTSENMPGTWSVSTDLKRAITVKKGLENALGNKANLLYAVGSNLVDDPELQKRATLFGRDIPRDTRSNETMIAEAVEIAKKADVIVATLGESSEMSGESASRTDIKIPKNQQLLLEALLKTGKPVVLVLFTGRPLDLSWENEHVPSILNVWFGGSETGNAIADVLFGDVNPSGKLTMTFPQNIGQIPIYYNHKNTGRPLKNGWFQKYRANYLDVTNEPLFPFGYGLSYTNFEFSDLTLDKNTLTDNDKITVSLSVKNTGKFDGEEVVQLYTRDLFASITRPVKELKGFKKIALKAGETQKVSFEINKEMLKFYNEDLQFIAEPGDFKVFVGNSATNVKEETFSLK